MATNGPVVMTTENPMASGTTGAQANVAVMKAEAEQTRLNNTLNGLEVTPRGVTTQDLTTDKAQVGLFKTKGEALFEKTVGVTGAITAAAGVTATTGGLRATAGGSVATTGDITASAGNVYGEGFGTGTETVGGVTAYYLRLTSTMRIWSGVVSPSATFGAAGDILLHSSGKLYYHSGSAWVQVAAVP